MNDSSFTPAPRKSSTARVKLRDRFRSQANRDLLELFNLGWKYVDNNADDDGPKDALKIVEKVLTIDRTSSDAFLLKAAALLKADQPAEALEAMDHAHRLNPRRAKQLTTTPRQQIAQAAAAQYLSVDKYDKALSMADSILSEYPHDGVALQIKLQSLKRDQRYEYAQRFLDKLIEHETDWVATRRRFASVKRFGTTVASMLRSKAPQQVPCNTVDEQGESTESRDTFDLLTLQLERARLLTDMNNHIDAKKAYWTCLQDHDPDIRVYREAIDFFVQQGFHEQAWHAFARCPYKKQLTASEYMQLVNVQEALERNPLSLINSALRLHPRSVDLHFAKGSHLLLTENARHAALQHFTDAVRIDKKHTEAWYFLGGLHETEDNVEKAHKCYTAGLKADPTHSLNRKGLDRMEALSKETRAQKMADLCQPKEVKQVSLTPGKKISL